MSAENSLSLQLYKYLCQKIGSEEEIKVRRFACLIIDIGISNTVTKQMISGSRGEGLDLKGSDYDVILIDPAFKVYESDNDVVLQSGQGIPLIMDTENTHPCFTQLRLPYNQDLTFETDEIISKFLCRKLSSELFMSQDLESITNIVGVPYTNIFKIHGPCVSTLSETLDVATSLICYTWISQAQPWIFRPRKTWPSSDLISKITSCGVLFVPIGYKGSINEHLQWRISFSVAEKSLIFSFNHVQLLCYALLKILIKEIVENHEDLKDLLCSYFMKILMFWMLEESDPSMWRPDKMIPCFMACFKRLIYCVEYSTLLHYFIPDNNLFYLRFNADEKDKTTRILQNLFQIGIYCFAQSETLFDIMTPSLSSTDSAIIRCVASLHELTGTFSLSHHRPHNLLYHFVHHSRSKISRSIFFVMLSFSHQNVSQISQYQQRSNNKHKYYKYKRDLSHLLIGTNSDAVSGWLLLASFFYVHGNYTLSLYIIHHALRKCTEEKLYPGQTGLDQNQENLLHLLERTELCSIAKALTVKILRFCKNSHISPQELPFTILEHSIPLFPIIFAHLLSFLCNYQLHRVRSCEQSLIQLEQTIMQHLIRFGFYSESIFLTYLGICHQMVGETYQASQYFLRAVQLDEHNSTSAATRLSNCNVD